MSQLDPTLAAFYLSDDPGEVLEAAQAQRSHGLVLKPEGLNARTGYPERGGLHCAVIFGPVQDFRCVCGKLASLEHEGQACDKCGVACISSAVRAERWGHLEPPLPLLHPVLAPEVARLLGCSAERLRARLRLEGRPSDAELAEPEEQAAVLAAAGPAWLIQRVPVTPPGLRATRRDPQDAAYAVLLNRCNRLRRLQELNAPAIILRNEETMAQLAFERAYLAVRAELRAHLARPRPEPHTEETAALLRAVLEHPGDDARRAAYAEHLLALDDPRGRFIALQLAGKGGRRRARLAVRDGPDTDADLLRRHFDRFLDPLGEVVQHESVVFRRGFLAACRVRDEAVEPTIGDPAWATVERVESDRVDLIAHPVMRSLRAVSTSAATFAELCRRPEPLHGITEASVRLARSTPGDQAALAGAEQFPALSRLTLVHGSKRTAPDPAWLEAAPRLSRLASLTVQAPLVALETLSLPAWLKVMEAHPALPALHLDLERGFVVVELEARGYLVDVTVKLSRAFVERAAIMVEPEHTGQLLAACQGLPADRLRSLRVHARSWFGDAMAALFRGLREAYGDAALVPRTEA